jgi:PQQ-dependent dehydrogenase (methanol/ethanol family)
VGRGHELIATLLVVAGCHDVDRPTASGASSGKLNDAKIVLEQTPPDDGEWTMAAHDFQNTRFSTLTDITTDNVKNLQIAWQFDIGTRVGAEGAPLVIGDTMYLITPFPNKVFALDLAKGGALKWSYEPNPDPAAAGVACCDQVNRGGQYVDGKIYYATLDGQVVCLDAKTGTELWKQKIGNINVGESITMAPIVVAGKVLVGNSGGEFGVRGWLQALDAATGTPVWKAYSTGPDQEVLIGDNFHPFYERDRGKDLGMTTWPPDRWRQGGGTVWGWVSYDPSLDLIYYGTGNPGPWNADMRPGDNKWTTAIFARKPETGEAIWAYQFSPHDLWDHDGINESILFDANVAGRRKQLLVHPERNGYIYVMDRATGEVLSADPYVYITTSRGVDLKTGELELVNEKAPSPGRSSRDVCPFAAGAKDWQPSALSPVTGLLYIPHQNMCEDIEYTDTSYIAGTPFVGAEVRYYAAPGSTRGRFTAWDPIARKAVWQIAEDLPVWSGTLVTASNVVFYGTMDGLFKAVDARTGMALWQVRLPSGIIGQPVTYRGPDGKQYVAVYSGVGGWSGQIVSLGLDPRDLTAGNGWGNAMGDLRAKTKPGGFLYVFALP